MNFISSATYEGKMFLRVMWEVQKNIRRGYRNIKRNLIISDALETPEGRAAIAEAMMEPIRKQQQYQNVSVQS